jgi:hypothetical protein
LTFKCNFGIIVPYKFWQILTRLEYSLSAAAAPRNARIVDRRLTEADRALIASVHEGVLKGNGRMIVGPVSVEVYRRVEEQVRQKIGVSPAPPIGNETEGAKPTSEQNTNINDKGPMMPSIAEVAPTAPDGKVVATTAASSSSGKPEPAPARDPWDRLHIGSNVLGKYWGDDGEPIGWWVGVIAAIDKNDFMIRWPDEPNSFRNFRKTPPCPANRPK